MGIRDAEGMSDPKQMLKMSIARLESVFSSMDANNDGKLDFGELCTYLGSAGAAACVTDCDTDADGYVSKEEFVNCLLKSFGEAEFEEGCAFLEQQVAKYRPEFKYETLRISQAAPGVLQCELFRPDNLNAMNMLFWDECRDFFQRIEADGSCRCVVLSGSGRMFTAGLDLGDGLPPPDEEDIAHAALQIYRMGKAWQESFSAIETCGKPVIACVHNACIGGGIEMISAADIRFCTNDSYFIAAEVNIGMAADVGGLQRFPKIVGNQSLVRELCMSGRKLKAAEALSLGFVSRVCDDKEAMLAQAIELAVMIASKSPVATHGIKRFLNYTRDHTVADSLEYAITWNLSMLQGSDMMTAAGAMMQKKKPEFPDLPYRLSKL